MSSYSKYHARKRRSVMLRDLAIFVGVLVVGSLFTLMMLSVIKMSYPQF